jgi:two-component system NtrC family sensor kinase
MVTRISLKLIIAVGLITIFIIGVYSYFSIKSQSDALIAQAEVHANKMGEAIKNSTLTSMLGNRRDEVHSIISTVAHDPSITEIRILNKEGVVAFSSRSDLIGKMVDKRAESCYACHAENSPLIKLPSSQRTRIYRISSNSPRTLAVINPIYNMPSCYEAACHAHSRSQTVLGVLDIKLNLADVDQQIVNSEIRLIELAAVAIAALSLFIAFFVRKWIGRPIRELVKATNQVSAGNLSYTIENPGKDELGILAVSFNKMTKNLAETKQQLFQSDKMASLGRLAAGVAHEINNPLTGVLTYSSFLLKRTKDDPEMQENLGIIVRETIRSREIVKSLLDFSRQSVPKKSKVDISVIIKNAVEIVANQLTLKKIKLETHLAASTPQATLDANQIQQVLINLLVNAADAISEDGGRISVDLSLISLSQFGLAQIKNAACPKKHDLMDQEIKIFGMPTVKLKIASDGSEGLLHLDPVYGKRRHQYGVEIVPGKNLRISCPKCNISLIEDNVLCPKCSATVYNFEVAPHGKIQGCVNPECGWQRWQAMDDAAPSEYIEIRIADSGQGIAKDDLTKIFEPFFTTKGQKGTGLGLAVTWGIIDNHGGTINVESEPGKGTIFIIHLPVQ